MSNGHNRIELVPAEIKIIWSDESKCNEMGGDGGVGDVYVGCWQPLII